MCGRVRESVRACVCVGAFVHVCLVSRVCVCVQPVCVCVCMHVCNVSNGSMHLLFYECMHVRRHAESCYCCRCACIAGLHACLVCMHEYDLFRALKKAHTHTQTHTHARSHAHAPAGPASWADLQRQASRFFRQPIDANTRRAHMLAPMHAPMHARKPV